jgi:hypothetical protein
LGAGTDSNVILTIFGAKDNTGELNLDEKVCKNQKKKDLFEKGSADVFEVEAKDIGVIDHIKIGHDGDKMNSPWQLESVKIECKNGTQM